MTVKEIIKAQEVCFLKQRFDGKRCCTDCPIFEVKTSQNCQAYLAENTIKKLNELVELLDDKVNHHYYDTLDQYQEMNSELQSKLDQIESILTKSQQ